MDKIKIIVPMSPDVDDNRVKEICNHFNCIAKKLRAGEYEVSTSDPLELFWLGMNFNNQINQKHF